MFVGHILVTKIQKVCLLRFPYLARGCSGGKNVWNVLQHGTHLMKDSSSSDATYCALKIWSCNAGDGVSFSEARIKFGPAPDGKQISRNQTDRTALRKAWRSTKGKLRAHTVLDAALKSLESVDKGLCRKSIGESVSCLKKFKLLSGTYHCIWYRVRSP